MGARREERELRARHRDWVHAHGDELSAMGLPSRIFESADDWTDFLESGHLHWHEDVDRFSFEDLTTEQCGALHRFLELQHAEGHHAFPLLGWLRVRAAPELTLPEEQAPTTAREAIQWLASRGAHPWLVRHHELVLEAAEEMVEGLRRLLRIRFDADHVVLGAAVHDAGKIEHPSEMRAPGHEHERAGEQMLLRSGFPAHIARVCVTHAAWSEPRATLEDRLIALADKLWKGKRDADLESAIMQELADRLGQPSWAIFDAFDGLCELVADNGPERLKRSDV